MEFIHFAYTLVFLFLLFGVTVYNGFNYQSKNSNRSDIPDHSKSKLSLIIAAKNEEQNIVPLINSLEKLNYRKEDFEVVIIDDNSTDKTAEFFQQEIKVKSNYKMIRAIDKKLDAKKGALAIGIEEAQHNLIVITDADCEPESKWVSAFASSLDYGYDFVFGVSPIRSGKKLVEKISAFENLRNSFLTISAVGLNIPYSATARSFGFRKKSFEHVGGYSNTEETISGDDDLLLREAVRNKMLIGTVIDPEAFVYTAAPKNFSEYFKQKKRHLQTSFYYLLKQKLFLAFWHIINLVSLFSIFLIFVTPILVLPFGVKLIYDLFIVVKYQKKLGHNFKFYEIFYLQILFELFIIINFLNSLFGKSEWK